LKNDKEISEMKTFEYTVKDPVGIHARPAGMLVKEIKKYASTVTISKGDKSVNALKLMALMGMGIKQGDTVKVTVEGADEDTAAAEIEAFFKANL
jgi:phosphocarrier protein